METAAMEERLLNLVRRVLNPADGREIAMDVDLSSVGLDSMRVIDLLLELETEFGLTFPDEMLTANTFRSPSTLLAAVTSLQAAA